MRIADKVMWLLIGAAAGAGIALLYAPKSGKDTRKLIRRRAEDARDVLTEKGENLLEVGRGAYRRSMDAATSAAGVFNRVRTQS